MPLRALNFILTIRTTQSQIVPTSDVPERGVVQITGSLNPLESESGLLEVVKSVPGVLEVRSEVVVPEIHEIG
jgi:hypothetical protein